MKAIIKFQKKHAGLLISLAVIYTLFAGSFILKDHLDDRAQTERIQRDLITKSIYMEDMIDE
jgi:hypothetical protein